MRLGDTSIYVVDTETTGLDAEFCAICEVALVRWLPPKYTGPARFEWSTLVNPGISIPSDATVVHGIRDADVADAPSISEAEATMRRFIPRGALVLSHKKAFDSAFLSLEGRLWGCTYRLSQRLWPDAPSFKNVDLARWVGVKVDSCNAHRALVDAKITAALFHQILRALIDRNGSLPHVEELVKWSESPYTHMPFSKYRGKRIAAVPTDYLEYASRKWQDAEPELRTAIQNELRRRRC